MIGVSPNGAITYISQCYEGSILDNDIVKKIGFLDKLEPGDLVVADRGFTIRDILSKRKVDLNIPLFLNEIAHFTVTNVEEMRAFFAVTMAMGISENPEYKDFWCVDPLLRNIVVASNMTFLCYEKLCLCNRQGYSEINYYLFNLTKSICCES